MFIKKTTAVIFGLVVSAASNASASLPCSGETHDVLFHIGNDNGDLVADLTIYNNDAGEAQYVITQFTSSHIVWDDYEGRGSNNSLYVTTILDGKTSIVISVTGNIGTLTINKKTQGIVCDWRR